jgi:hypothetical protein
LAAAGIAATAAYNNSGYGYGNYGYGLNYGPGPYTGTPNYIYTTATYPRYICGHTVVPGYGYAAAGYGNNMDTEIITAVTGGRVSVPPLSVRPPLAPLLQALLPSGRTLGSRKPYVHTDTTMLASGKPKGEMNFGRH